MRLIRLGALKIRSITLAKQLFWRLEPWTLRPQAMQYFVVSFLGQVMKESNRLFSVA